MKYFLFKKQTSERVRIRHPQSIWEEMFCSDDEETKSSEDSPREYTDFVAEISHPMEAIEHIKLDPMKEYFILEGKVRPLKVTMPVMIDGKPLHEAV